jgi:hypothetical protein
MSEYKTFWQHPIGKKLGYAIHEQNSGIGKIKGQVLMLRRHIESNTEINLSLLEERLKSIEAAIKQQQDGMDYAYKNIKKELGY